MNEVVRWAGTLLVHASTVAAVAFVVVYGLLVKWRSTPMGRHVMAFMSALAAILLLSSIRLIFGDAPWFQLLRTAVFVGVPVVLYWRLWILIRTQVGMHRLRLSRKRRSESEEDA